MSSLTSVTISRRAWLTLGILSSTLLVVFFSETMLLPAIPEIMKDFSISYGTAAWIFKDTHRVKLGLLSNATTIDNALHYIRTKQQQKGLVWILLVVTTAIVVMVISFPSIITCNELVSYL